MNGNSQIAGFWTKGIGRALGAMSLFASTLLTSAAAWAACDVSLVTVFANGQAVLKADCGSATISDITWYRNTTNNPLNSTPVISLQVVPTSQDIYYTTAITTGTSTFTATGNNNPLNPPVIPAGKSATITTGQTALRVAATLGGTVTSNPVGISCTSAGGATCEASFSMGTPVTLTASTDTNFAFSGWSGDCGGAAACVVSMTSPRTVVATFNNAPITGNCGSANGVSTAIAPSGTSLCSAGTATAVNSPTASLWNFTWSCNGANTGGNASCSAPDNAAGTCGPSSNTTPVTSAPSGAGLCTFGNASAVATTSSSFTWTCSANGGPASSTCSVPQQQTPGVCGSANGNPQSIAPTGAAACSSGSLVNMTNPNNTFAWTCNGLGGSTVNASCTANQTINGACGTSNGQTFASLTSSGSNLCAAGNAVTAFTTGAGPWTWGCNGASGGANTSATACSAALQPPTQSATGCVKKEAGYDADSGFPYARGFSPNDERGLRPRLFQEANTTYAWRITRSAMSAAQGGTSKWGSFNVGAYTIAMSLSTNPCQFEAPVSPGSGSFPTFCTTYTGGLGSTMYAKSIAQYSVCTLPPADAQGNVWINVRLTNPATGGTIDPTGSTCVAGVEASAPTSCSYQIFWE